MKNCSMSNWGGGCLVGFSLVLAASFLITADARAELVGVYNDRDMYMNTVPTSDWTFESFNQIGDDTKSPLVWEFDVWNEVADTRSTGTLTVSGHNGNSGFKKAPQVDVNTGALTFSHGSANNLDLAFSFDFSDAGPFIDSYYLEMDPKYWNNTNTTAKISFTVKAEYWYDGDLYTTDVLSTLDQNNWFFGIAFNEGAYLSQLHIWSTGASSNNGYVIAMGFGGDASAPAAPEPATILIFGFGATGLGLAAACRRKNKDVYTVQRQ